MKIFKIWNLNFKIYIIYMYVQFQLKNLLVFQLLLSVMCTLLFADFHNNIFEFYRHFFKRKHFIKKNLFDSFPEGSGDVNKCRWAGTLSTQPQIQTHSSPHSQVFLCWKVLSTKKIQKSMQYFLWQLWKFFSLPLYNLEIQFLKPSLSAEIMRTSVFSSNWFLSVVCLIKRSFLPKKGFNK